MSETTTPAQKAKPSAASRPRSHRLAPPPRNNAIVIAIARSGLLGVLAILYAWDCRLRPDGVKDSTMLRARARSR